MGKDLINEISPSDVQEEIEKGFERLESARRMRTKTIRAAIGSHTDSSGGNIGAEALNLIFNMERILLPNLVLNFPVHNITTPYMQQRQYAKSLGLALSYHDKKIDIKNVYRRLMIEALHSIGILKTGLAQSDSIYALDGEQAEVSLGDIFTEIVSFDDFVADPLSREYLFRDARFLGHRVVCPRDSLLESGLYDEDMVMRLPQWPEQPTDKERAERLTQKNINPQELGELEDNVAIVEVWVPSANAIVTVPGTDKTKFDDYIRVADYYGVKEGPYTFLAFSPPVPDNPIPVPLANVLYDPHVLANLMAKKLIDQATRQKSVLAYKRSASDDAAELVNAADGETVAVDDPTAFNKIDMGGQVATNEDFTALLMNWFNMMAANPEQLGGSQVQAKSATAANVLQQNANIFLSDMKDLVYICAAEEARKRAFYFHTDPLIKLPMVKRQATMSQVLQGPYGPVVMPPSFQDVQVFLTPEQRSGDFFDFNFDIQPESMGRQDSKVRLQQEQVFCTQLLPAVVTAATQAAAIGLPINAPALLIRMGQDLGINDLDEIILDPAYLAHSALMGAVGPQNQGKGTPGQMLQSNGQPGTAGKGPPSGPQQNNMAAQEGAQDAQRMLRTEIGHALTAPAIHPTSAGI